MKLSVLTAVRNAGGGNALVTDLKHLLHWTLLLRFALCQHVLRPSVHPFIHSFHRDQFQLWAKEMRDELPPHRPLCAWVHWLPRFSELPSAELFRRSFGPSTEHDLQCTVPPEIRSAPVNHPHGTDERRGLPRMEGVKSSARFTSLHAST